MLNFAATGLNQLFVCTGVIAACVWVSCADRSDDLSFDFKILE